MNNNNIECEERGRCPEKLCIVTIGGHESAKEDHITNNNKQTHVNYYFLIFRGESNPGKRWRGVQFVILVYSPIFIVLSY